MKHRKKRYNPGKRGSFLTGCLFFMFTFLLITSGVSLYTDNISTSAAGSPVVSTRPQNSAICKPYPVRGIELSCTDKPVTIGVGGSVFVRATCPGIFALLHKKVDQASFDPGLLTYRHLHFAGVWNVRDSGTVRSVPAKTRELFLLLPGDLLEIRLEAKNCRTRVQIRSLGYLVKGNVTELKHWISYYRRMEGLCP